MITVNITEAATIVTETVAQYIDHYLAADELTDPRIVTAFGETNHHLNATLHTDDLDILFADFADVMDADSTLGGYLVRHTEAPAQSAERDAALRDYLTHLNDSLRSAGHKGDDFTAEQFAELKVI